MDNRPDSPCIGVCTTLFDDICQGCGRTAEEVAHWVFYTEEEKSVIWQRLMAQAGAKGSKHSDNN